MKWLLAVILLVVAVGCTSAAYASDRAKEAFHSIDKECYDVHNSEWKKLRSILLPSAVDAPRSLLHTQVCLPRSLLYDVILLRSGDLFSDGTMMYTHYRCRSRGTLWFIQHPENPSTWKNTTSKITIEACKRLLKRTWRTK